MSGRGGRGAGNASGNQPIKSTESIDDEDDFSDRTQTEKGEFDGKIVAMMGKMRKSTVSLEQRQKKWKQQTVEQKMAKFKKIFHPQSTKKTLACMKEPCIEAFAHITQPAKGRFGIPLQKFPESKYNYSRVIIPIDERPIDYSVDEYDMHWMSTMNAIQMKLGKEIFSVAIFEHWVDRLEKLCIWKPKEHHKLRDENGVELDDVCNICLDGDTSNCNQIVYCDRCNLTVHQDCYGIPFIPEGCLECRRCVVSPGRRVSCVLCPSKKGAFKQVDHNRWVHVLCVIWVDETHFGNTIFMENVQNVEKALHDRKALSCMLCKDRKYARTGACIQCSEAKCTASFHVTCARNFGLVMRINETDEGQVNRFVWCPKHKPEQTEADLEQHELMLRNARRENEKKLPMISMPTVDRSIICTIKSEQPFSDFREIVLFWYQKRLNRLGAPLLKMVTSTDVTPMTSPNKKMMDYGRRLQKKPTTGGRWVDKNLAVRQMTSVGSQFGMAGDLFGMIAIREEQKKDLVNTACQLLTFGFKPIQKLCIETIRELQRIDIGKVFAEPVELMGYREIIKQPICLKDMTFKAEHGKYDTVSHLSADVSLMLQNCATFNKGNRAYIKYGKTYEKDSTKILEKARKEEAERTGLKVDKEFMTHLLNGVMADYNGWSNAHTIPSAVKKNRGRRPGRRQSSPIKVEDVTDEDDVIKIEIEEAPPTFSTRKSRKRGIQETSDETPEAPPTRPKTRNSEAAEDPSAHGAPATQHPIFRKRGIPEDSNSKNSNKKSENPLNSTSSAPQKQTKMTSFFSGTPRQTHVTFAGKGPFSGDETNSEASQPNLFQTPITSTSKLFSTSTNSFLAPATSSGGRPATRSTSGNPFLSGGSTPSTTTTTNTTNTTTTPSITRRSTFRISSSAIQSPLPAPKKLGHHAMDSDDEEAEIQIQPPPQIRNLSPEELKAEKLKSAENEAMSKFAHNQLVIVDGRAAKVIDSQLAHLTDIHQEQRQSMMKKRREVLSEIPSKALIYVEFFQKSNIVENFQWVPPEKVELLDLNNANQRSPKIPGLKAAREWHQKVINGEDV